MALLRIQWCLLYLTDTDVQAMFQKAAVGLKPDGLIFVKENVCKEGFIVDNDDSSLTRSNAYMLELFEKSNMQASYIYHTWTPLLILGKQLKAKWLKFTLIDIY